MVRNLLLLGLVALAVTVYALIECIRAPRSAVRSISKPAWILAIVLLPLVGALLWFWLGRPRSGAPAGPSRTARGPLAPDDNPEFLRSLEAERRRRARQEERRRREAPGGEAPGKGQSPAQGEDPRPQQGDDGEARGA